MVDSTPGPAADTAGVEETFPRLLARNVQRFGDRHAIREKEFGIWQSWTWRELGVEVRSLACGLAALGLERGEKIAVVGDNRPRLYASMCAAQCLGAVPVPMYQDSVASELQYVLEHAEARVVLAEDQEQVDKILEVMDQCPLLRTIIYDDARGMRHYRQDWLHSFADVQERGRAHDRDNPGFYDAEVAAGSGSDPAIILYTSGTTGRPKGVVLTHDNVIVTARNAVEFDGLTVDEEVLAYLPMAWVGDNVFSFGEAYVAGFCVNCPESGATVLEDLREVGPSYFFAPPPIFENLLTTIMIRMEDASSIKQRIFHHFMRVARDVGIRIIDGEDVSFGDRMHYRLGELLVYGPLKNTLGFSRIRVAYTAGEAIGPDIFDFYRGLGINMKQLYGQTEASVFITIQKDGEIKPDTVGKPATGVEVRIEDSGEVMYRSPGVFHSYYKNPEATATTKTEDGWVHTGDAGFFGDDGHLRIIDRAKDVGKLVDGGLFAPKYIENKLKFFPQIKEAVAFGADREFATVIININLEAVGNWAERNNVGYASYQELASNPSVVDIIAECIDKVNVDLAAEPRLANSQIRRFVVLHKELDPDDGELTRTRKVRRGFIAERYDVIVDALYSGAKRCKIDTEIKYEDGRVGRTSADLEIRDLEPRTPLAEAS